MRWLRKRVRRSPLVLEAEALVTGGRERHHGGQRHPKCRPRVAKALASAASPNTADSVTTIQCRAGSDAIRGAAIGSTPPPIQATVPAVRRYRLIDTHSGPRKRSSGGNRTAAQPGYGFHDPAPCNFISRPSRARRSQSCKVYDHPPTLETVARGPQLASARMPVVTAVTYLLLARACQWPPDRADERTWPSNL